MKHLLTLTLLILAGCSQNIAKHEKFRPDGSIKERAEFKQNLFLYFTSKKNVRLQWDNLYFIMGYSEQQPDPNSIEAVGSGLVKGAALIGGM